MTTNPLPPAGPPWSATPRGRRELAAVALFVAANVALPLVYGELYPFSRAPMFYDAPQCYCVYKLTAPDGKCYADPDLSPFGLHCNYWGNPPDLGMGIRPPPSVDRFGAVVGEEDICREVRRWLAAHPEVAYLDVTREVIGPADALAVGPVGAAATWRVLNPGR